MKSNEPMPFESKAMLVKKYAVKYGLKMFVETGTYRGDMCAFAERLFRKVISIELSDHYYEESSARFCESDRVVLLQGDSAAVLPGVVKLLRVPALFWLDAHWSGGKTAKGNVNNPILSEIRCVLGDKVNRHVMLIDDVRLFGADGWPEMGRVVKTILGLRKDAKIVREGDVLAVA